MSIFTFRCCADPREHGHSFQHGLGLYNGIYVSRRKISGVPKPEKDGSVSTTGAMLVQVGLSPDAFFVQGHRSCAAVKVLFDSYGKDPADWNATEREFQKDHGEALAAVKKICATTPKDVSPEIWEKVQLTLLEKACILQSINNVIDMHAANHSPDIPPMFAYYSLSPAPQEFERFRLPLNASQAERDAMLVQEIGFSRNIPLMIYDPARKIFVHAPREGNEPIRIVDLINPDNAGIAKRLSITSKIDLEDMVLNELPLALAQHRGTLEPGMPRFEVSKAMRSENSRRRDTLYGMPRVI